MEEKRVAADTVEMIAEEVGRSLQIAGGRDTEDLDVVAFPVHLPATVTLARGSSGGVEVGEGELEGRVGFDGEAQRDGGLAAVDGSLCLPVERRGPRACRDRAAMDLNCGSGGVQVITLADGRILSSLHESHVALAA